MFVHPVTSSSYLLTFALLASASCPLEAAEQLEMRFQKGETFGYRIEQDINLEGTAQGQQIKSKIHQILSMSTHVKSVEKDGSAKVEQVIDRVQMSMELPAQTIEIDTDNNEPIKDPLAKLVGTNLSKMVDQPVEMTITPQGEMTDVVIPEQMKQAQQQPGVQLGSGQLEQMFKQSGLRLPAESISEGHTWDQKSEMPMPQGTMGVTTTYTYNGKNDSGLLKIDANMDITLTPDENAPVKMTATAKEAGGKFLFDNTKGRLQSSVVKQVMEMQIAGIGNQIVTTNVIVTLTEGRKQKPASSNE